MARKRKISTNQIKALLELLTKIEDNLPNDYRFVVSDDGNEQEIEFREFEGFEVSAVEVIIDTTLSQFQKDKVIPKIKKGKYSLSGAFELLFGKDSEITNLAIDLETALSGYQDLIWEDDISLARSLIEDIEKEIKDAADKT